ncbi:cytochrome C [Gemmobacter serpentinus]|uniref:cytochrome C n=1 Tax=Gemmobacter serpentinus TaxID=2652247 RepID=UPI00124DEDBE|nr:cytochrome C [Gemmobacter serpentinus]
MNPQTPVPVDLPLPLPAPVPVLVAVLLIFFLMHIVFINMMIGGAFLTLWYEIKGRTSRKWDNLAHDLAASITVNKSIAVVLGVGPLLAINTLYTTYFYSANALTGDFWISVIPLVAGAFLLTYLHKYLWHKLPWGLHVGVMALVVAIFAFIPLIFLTQITLMLQPERWTEVRGFWDALQLPNLWVRYAHFILSCPAMIGFMMVWAYRRKPEEDIAEIGIPRAELIRTGWRWAFWPSVLQFIVGPLAWLTLPEVPGPTQGVDAVFALSAVAAAIACALIWLDMKAPDAKVGRGFWPAAGAMLLVIAMMVAGRHMYREAAVGEHRLAVAEKTADFVAASKAARDAAASAAEAVE